MDRDAAGSRSSGAAGSGSSDAAGSRPIKRQARSLPDWAMLDCYLRPSHPRDSSTLVYVSTGIGGQIGVGLMAATPPRISYLVYHWTADEGRRAGSSHKTSQINFWEAKAVAAHRNSILLRFFLPVNRGAFPAKREVFFVYQATVRTLMKLPTCHHKFMKRNTDKNAGILCRESGGFVVARLTVRTEGPGDCRVTAELCRIFGEEGTWHTTKCVPICLNESQQKDLIWWETDAVIPFGGFICWVDYLRGILFCNVFSQDPEVKFVSLPISPYPGSCHPFLHARGPLPAYRSVCVTKDGDAMKFIDVAPVDSWFRGRQQGVPRPTIKSWTLTSERLWREDLMMEEADFFALIRDNKLTEEIQVESPLVHMRDPEVIYLALVDGPRPCLLEVNLKSGTMNVTSSKIECFESSCMDSNSISCGLQYHERLLPLSLDAPNITRPEGTCGGVSTS